MILIEGARILGLEPTIRGMQNSTDSGYCETHGPSHCSECPYISTCNASEGDIETRYIIGPNDLDLMLRLAKAGSVDGKFRRMIVVYVDITAPLYWWKEFDVAYKVNMVADSCSAMHKIHAKEFTVEDFSCEHLEDFNLDDGDCPYSYADGMFAHMIDRIVEQLNVARNLFLKTNDKKYWWQMIQLLPSSYNQKRTVMLNYEVLANIYQHRRNHKLDEWREVCRWIEGLPYSEIITCNVAAKKEQVEPTTSPSEEDLKQIESLKSALNELSWAKWTDEQKAKILQAWGDIQKEGLE